MGAAHNDMAGSWLRQARGLIVAARLPALVALTVSACNQAERVIPAPTPQASSAPPTAESANCEINYVVLPHDGRLVPDPAKYVVDGTFLYNGVYSGLTGLNPVTGEPVPALAASYSSSDDGRVYTFRLRDGLKFSDGTPVEPADIEFSWARALSPELRSPWSEYVLGNIVGADQVGADSARELAGFTIVDASTIEVSLATPDVDFPAKLANRVASVLKESNVDQWAPYWTDPWIAVTMDGWWGLSDLPVGTGPLKVDELDYWNNSAVLMPNEHYWGESSGSTGVIHRDQFEDENSPVTVLDDARDSEFGSELIGVNDLWIPSLRDFDIVEAGVNYVLSPRMFRDERHDWIVDSLRLGYQRELSARLPEVSFLAMNSAVAPFDDVNFRRALFTASDLRHLNYWSDSVAVPRRRALGLLPADGRSTRRNEDTDADRELSVELMERSRYAHNLFNHRIEFHSLGALMPFDFNAISSHWDDLFGVNVSVDEGRRIGQGLLLFSVGPDNVQRYNHELESGTLQLRFVEVQPTSNSPEEILGLFRNLFGPNADSPEVREVNALLDAAAAEADVVKRTQLYADIEAHILDRALVIPISWGSTTNVDYVREWISGYEPSRYPSSLFKNVTVDTSHPDYPSDRPCR